MKKVVVIIGIVALVFLGLSSGAFCAQQGHSGGSRSGGGYYGGTYHGGGHYYHGGGSHFFIGGYFGFPYYTYPYGHYPYDYSYYYPYTYPRYSYTYDQPTVYIEQEQSSYWYHCQDPEGYYPYVTSCPGGWTSVTPTPPGEGSGTK
jgi:hypothetical protein